MLDAIRKECAEAECGNERFVFPVFRALRNFSGESYRLEKEDFLGWVLWDLYKGSWRKFYSFTEEPQLVADFVALNFYCEKHPESPFNKQEMFALKTLDGRRTLDGNLYKEIHNGTVTARELRPEEMPEAYAKFGLTYGK